MSLYSYNTQNMAPPGMASAPGLPTRVPPVGLSAPTIVTQWKRNPDWLAMPSISDTDVKVIGLHLITTDSNFASVRCSGSLGYSVFWGDSSVSCTFQDAGDTVTAVAHGLVNNDKVMFNTIVTTTGFSIDTVYFVVNKTADTFQISLTSGGSAIALTNDGSGTINIPEKVASNTQSVHQYTYSTIDTGLATTGLVTFTDSGDLVSKTAHGRVNGDIVSFASITSTTGISINTPYYVVNATANDYQLSLTDGGSPVTLTTDGTGSTLDYKQVIVTIVPQNTGTLTTVNFYQKHTQTLLQNGYSTGWLDITIAGSDITTLTIGANTGTPTVHYSYLEQVSVLSSNLSSCDYQFKDCFRLSSVPFFKSSSTFSAVSMFSGCSSLTILTSDIALSGSLSSMFTSCFSLRTVPLFNTAAVTTMASMFSTCYSLQTVPLFNTASVTSMSSMFNTCPELISVPLFNTAKVTTMSIMFQNCYKLQTVPLFNTAAVTTMSSMFNNCSSLTSVPLFNTTSVTDMSTMFGNCNSLRTVPLFNTAAVTTMASMFSTCYSLQTVPLFNTAAVTTMASMFNNCFNITTVPLFNTASVTSMASMFNTCSSLVDVPLFVSSSVTTMASMFSTCSSLRTVPLFNTAAVTDMSSMFSNCPSLLYLPLFNTASVNTMASMFNGTSSLRSIPAFNTASVTTMSNMFTTSGILNIPELNTTAVTTFGLLSTSNAAGIISSAITNCTKTINYTGQRLSVSAINTILDNLGISAAQTITLTNNWGSQTAISTASVTSVAGTKVLTMASTTGLVVGMEMTGTGVAGVAQAVTFTDVGDLVNFTAHGIPNGTQVAFATIVTTTGIAIKTIYYVVNANTNDFQVSLTPGGSAIALTTNGSGTILYPNTIISIVPNTSVTMNVNSYASGTNTMTSTTIRRSAATLRGWSCVT